MARLVAALVIGILSVAAASPAYAQPPTLLSSFGVLENIIKYLAPIAAVAFLFMVIFAGYKFLTSGGDAKGTAGARSTLTFAILGIILVVAAWLILTLIGALTGVDVTTVEIPNP